MLRPFIITIKKQENIPYKIYTLKPQIKLIRNNNHQLNTTIQRFKCFCHIFEKYLQKTKSIEES